MNIIATVALAVYGTWLIGVICWKGVAKMKKDMGLFFCIVVAGFIHCMATKPEGVSVTFDDYLANNGTEYTASGGATNGVKFAWRKTNVQLPDTQPLYISKSTNSIDWVLIATTTVGSSPCTVEITNAKTFRYYVWHEWMPPTPVHTNGVWLGNVIEKAKGSKGIDKLLIIQGELRKDGKVIAP